LALLAVAAAATAKRAKAEAVEAAAAAIEKARADSKAEDLIQYLVLRGDPPSGDVIRRIGACEDATVLGSWLLRAYDGEKAAEIFPESQRKE
jgi:uncharacterized protein YijF (DUF1287 family)